MSTPFRERNPVPIGVISIVALVLLLLVAFNASKLPLIGSGDTYHADFSEAGGLKAGDEVRIAGVRVGKVKKVELKGDHVQATFQVESKAHFGNQTGAEIRIKTLLGQMFVALIPKGPGQMDKGGTIPASRTKSAFDVVDAFQGLASRTESINTQQLGQAFNTLAAATKDTPAAFQGTLRGLSRLSQTVASRNEQIGLLLRNLDTVSGNLSVHEDDIVTLMRNGDILLRALVARRQSVHRLLVSTSQLSEQLTALVRQSRADIGPALSHLQNVVNLLLKNQSNLDESLRLMAPFYHVFANTLGSGPWFDTYIANLPPVPAIGNGG